MAFSINYGINMCNYAYETHFSYFLRMNLLVFQDSSLFGKRRETDN